jgi:hypothetical protein
MLVRQPPLLDDGSANKPRSQDISQHVPVGFVCEADVDCVFRFLVERQ